MAVSVRVLLGIWLALVAIGFSPYRAGSGKEDVDIFSANMVEYAFFNIWEKWDGANYVNLIKYGYTPELPGHTNYGPLYPFGAQAVDRLLFHHPILTALLVSFIFAAALVAVLYAYILDVFKDEGLARDTIWLLLFYPASFFFFAPFSDGLFVLLAILFFIALRKEKWVYAGAAALLAGLARTQGALLILPLLYELYRKRAQVFPASAKAALAGVLLSPLGVVGFALYKLNLGYPSPIEGLYQSNTIIFVNPVKGYTLALKQFFETHSLLVLSEILSLTLFAALLMWMISQKRFRDEAALLVYSAANLLLFLSKYASQATALQSSNRYVLSLFPVFIGMAALVSRLSPGMQKIIRLLFFGLLLITSAAFGLGYFIG